MRLVAVMSCFGLLGLAGCVTPSIPIPPPDPSMMTFHITTVGTNATAVLTYPATDAYRGGVAFVYNRNLGAGIIQRCNTDGSIGPTQPTTAKAGDEMVVSVQVGDQTESTCIVLQEGVQNPTAYCGP
jgi:hypothetical protein